MISCSLMRGSYYFQSQHKISLKELNTKSLRDTLRHLFNFWQHYSSPLLLRGTALISLPCTSNPAPTSLMPPPPSKSMWFLSSCLTFLAPQKLSRKTQREQYGNTKPWQGLILLFFNSHQRICLLILESEEEGESKRERERERERERNMDERNTNQLPPIHTPTGDGTRNLGMYPDQESNPQHVGALDDVPTNWATQPELGPHS